MIQAVTLDFWRTLFVDTEEMETKRRRIRQERIRYYLAGQSLDIDGVLLDSGLEAVSREGYRMWLEEQRSIGPMNSARCLAEALHLSLSETQIAGISIVIEEAALSALPEPLPGVMETVPSLAQQYRLAVICDTGVTTGRVLRQVLRHYGLQQHFRHLTFSDEVGSTKPSPEPFLRTLAELGVKAEEAVHVGDMLHSDIAGAKQVGMKAILIRAVPPGEGAFDTAIRDHTPDGVEPDAVVGAFAELPATIARLA